MFDECPCFHDMKHVQNCITNISDQMQIEQGYGQVMNTFPHDAITFFSWCARLPWLRICVRRVCVTNVVNTILPQHVRLKVMWVVLTTSPAHCTYAEQLECDAMFEFFLFWMFCTAGTLSAAYWMKSRMQMMFLGTAWTHDVQKHGWCGFRFFFKWCTYLSKSMTRSPWFNDIDSCAESVKLICTADQYPVAHMRHSTSPYVPPMSNRCCLDFQNPKQNLCSCFC